MTLQGGRRDPSPLLRGEALGEAPEQHSGRRTERRRYPCRGRRPRRPGGNQSITIIPWANSYSVMCGFAQVVFSNRPCPAGRGKPLPYGGGGTGSVILRRQSGRPMVVPAARRRSPPQSRRQADATAPPEGEPRLWYLSQVGQKGLLFCLFGRDVVRQTHFLLDRSDTF